MHFSTLITITAASVSALAVGNAAAEEPRDILSKRDCALIGTLWWGEDRAEALRRVHDACTLFEGTFDPLTVKNQCYQLSENLSANFTVQTPANLMPAELTYLTCSHQLGTIVTDCVHGGSLDQGLFIFSGSINNTHWSLGSPNRGGNRPDYNKQQAWCPSALDHYYYRPSTLRDHWTL
ncbi:hypothetical protein CMUS01_06820 [Colletotrichum musicola]|uniref:Uncharacterized protein n=1 Tax=Colletotrichum musicola TaxID=2175873 RepID=A0A8H6NGN3_9PEZI|nr:hypothetical protein CMUS01_06820 [Colletotrichum musicola]